MSSNKPYPNNKEILYLLGMGALLTGAILIPGLGLAAGAIYKAKRKTDWNTTQKQWQRFNLSLLRRNINRLHQQKVIEIIEQNGQEIIKLTQKGQTKFLKFKLEELSLKGKSWDRRWWLILYDIDKLKRSQQDSFRRMLKQMKFYPLQKSVYLIPYQCREEIEYLREYFNLSSEVLIIEVKSLENEEYYKQYFGL